MYMHTYIHTCIHAYIHTYIHHAYVASNTYIHTYNKRIQSTGTSPNVQGHVHYMTYLEMHAPHVTHIYSEFTDYKYKALAQATRPIPRHAVLLAFGLKPLSQLAHIDAS